MHPYLSDEVPLIEILLAGTKIAAIEAMQKLELRYSSVPSLVN